MPFADALTLAHTLRLVSSRGWGLWWKNKMHPASLPSRPDRAYKDRGWEGWGHWLGTGNTAGGKQATHFLPFAEALVVARSLRLPRMREWQAWSKEGLRPANVPSMPNRVYKDHGWQGWGHWLGSSNHKTKVFLPFQEAQDVARSLRLSSASEWRAWSKSGVRPANVPACPDCVYKDHGWQGWGHWLGSNNTVGGQQATHFLPFVEALVVARSLRLPGRREWNVWSKEGLRPANVPSAPHTVYKDHGWQGWGHWLGTGNQGNPTVLFLPFAKALVVAHFLRLPGRMEWNVWSKEGLRPSNVPSHPDRVYKDHGWQGWGHWLGSSNQATKLFLPFNEALVVARSLRLPGRIEWQVWSKEGLRPANVPSNPNVVYKDHGWQGWGHWLQHARPGPEAAATPDELFSSGVQTKRAPAPAAGSPGKRRRR